MTRTRLSPEQRRTQLLDLGLELLAVHGLDGLSIDTLAEHAGISRGLLYHYFSDKRAFHLAVLRRMADEVVARTAPVGEGTPLEQMAGSLQAYVDFVAENRDAYRSFVRSAKGGDAEFDAIYQASRRALLDRIYEVTSPEDLAALGLSDDARGRLLVRGWAALVEETVLVWIDATETMSREELVRILAAALPGIVAGAD